MWGFCNGKSVNNESNKRIVSISVCISISGKVVGNRRFAFRLSVNFGVVYRNDVMLFYRIMDPLFIQCHAKSVKFNTNLLGSSRSFHRPSRLDVICVRFFGRLLFPQDLTSFVYGYHHEISNQSDDFPKGYWVPGSFTKLTKSRKSLMSTKTPMNQGKDKISDFDW